MNEKLRRDVGAPKAVDRSTFEKELDALRFREKAHTHEGDAIAAARRRLPMVEMDPGVPLIGANGPVTLLDTFEGRGQLIAYYFMCTPATLHRSSARAARGLHRRSASVLIFIRATSPSPCFAKGRTMKARGTATSWVGRCRGTRPKTRSTLFWLGAG